MQRIQVRWMSEAALEERRCVLRVPTKSEALLALAILWLLLDLWRLVHHG